jgi:hypothetical protein
MHMCFLFKFYVNDVNHNVYKSYFFSIHLVQNFNQEKKVKKTKFKIRFILLTDVYIDKFLTYSI